MIVADAGVGLYILGVGIIAYVLPIIIGQHRGVPNLKSVAAINVLLGWTLIGWVVALAMALRDAPAKQVIAPPTPHSMGNQTIADVSRLADLHSRGALTDDEFAAAKQRLLGTTR